MLAAAGNAAAQPGPERPAEPSSAESTADTAALPGGHMLAPMFVGMIEYLRDDALMRNAGRIPDDVRRLFSGYLPDALLDSVRWRVDEGELSLQRSVFLLGETRALTADNVILFASEEATRSPLLWAHELYHVSQYAAWGVDGFAARYLSDYETIEHAANEFMFRWKDSAATTELDRPHYP